MPQFNKKGWMAVLFIFSCLAVPFGLTYYLSTPQYKARHKQWQTTSTAASVPIKSQISVQKVLLAKDDRVKVKNTCLVFKGLEKGQVTLDLYLIELDPDHPYPQRFSAKKNGTPIRLGDMIYLVETANNSFLTLKILQTMFTY